MTASSTVSSKQGEHDVMGAPDGNGAAPDPWAGQPQQAKRATNPVVGDVTFEDHKGRSYLMRPTFEAALEIEQTLGVAIDALWTKFRLAGLQPQMSPTTREYGVVLAAGIRAGGEQRANPDGATRLAWEIGRKALREPVITYMEALCNGGRARMADLEKKETSSSVSDAEVETINEVISELQRRSGDTSA